MRQENFQFRKPGIHFKYSPYSSFLFHFYGFWGGWGLWVWVVSSSVVLVFKDGIQINEQNGLASFEDIYLLRQYTLEMQTARQK